MKILVTGGSGFLGFGVVKALQARGDTAIAFDATISPQLAALDKTCSNVTVFSGDIADPISVIDVFKKERPDAVVHCAAIVGVANSLGSPLNVLRVNLHGSINVLDAMRLFDTRRMIHISSCEVYGDFQSPVVDESHPLNPLMPYGICKLAVEQFGRTYVDLYGIECINLRGSWIYGSELPRIRLPNLLVDAVLAGRPLHLPSGGESLMDYIHLDDYVDATLAALDKVDHPYDVYNIGFGQATSLSQLFGLVEEIMSNADISVGPGRYEFNPGTPMRIQGALDISRASEALGFTPKIDLRRGLELHIAEKKGV